MISIFYYKSNVHVGEKGYVSYDLDAELIVSPLYNDGFTTVYFQSENQIDNAEIEEITQDEYASRIVVRDMSKSESDPQPTETELLQDHLEKLEQENVLLKAQNQALTDRTDFHEELIAEMAMIVYP